MLWANDSKSLQEAYMKIAIQIGHDILSARYPNQDLYQIWGSLSPDEKVEAFKSWLGHPDNRNALLIIDDVDGLKNENLIKDALPHQANNILYSTRDPSLAGTIRGTLSFSLSTMTENDLLALMKSSFVGGATNDMDSGFSKGDLEGIAKVLHGHPLGALNAVSYTRRRLAQQSKRNPVTDFLDIMAGSDHEARRDFLEYKPKFGLSIMDTFDVSRQRLGSPNGLAWILMRILSFLDTDKPYVEFLSSDGPLLAEMQPQLRSSSSFARKSELSQHLDELESVSFGTRLKHNGPLQFHHLWIECTRQCMENEGRTQVASDVIMHCYGLMQSKATKRRSPVESQGEICSHLRSCLEACRKFSIDLNDLGLGQCVLDWIQETEQPDTNLIISDNEPNDHERLLVLQQHCHRAEQQFRSLDSKFFSNHEANSAAIQILKQLENQLDVFERSSSAEIPRCDALPKSMMDAHMEVYDRLIAMARHPRTFSHLWAGKLNDRQTQTRAQYERGFSC